MQINKINACSFGAHKDSATRDWLFATKRFDKADTDELEQMLQDTYKDRYISTRDNNFGITEMKIRPAKLPILGVPDIIIYENKQGKPLVAILPLLVERMKEIRDQRDEWQVKYDENF